MKWCSILLLCCFCMSLNAQSRKRKKMQIFEGGVLFGMNISQMDGDYFTGFNKTGLYGGLRGIVNITPRISFNMELLYSQKGSKIPHGIRVTRTNEENDRIVELNYAEVPLLFRFYLTPENVSPFIEVGSSFSKLLKTNITERPKELIDGTVYEEIVDDFNPFDFNAVVGLGFNIKQKIGITFRYNYGVVKFYDNDTFIRPGPLSALTKEVEFLRNYYVSLILSYKIK